MDIETDYDYIDMSQETIKNDTKSFNNYYLEYCKEYWPAGATKAKLKKLFKYSGWEANKYVDIIALKDIDSNRYISTLNDIKDILYILLLEQGFIRKSKKGLDKVK